LAVGGDETREPAAAEVAAAGVVIAIADIIGGARRERLRDHPIQRVASVLGLHAAGVGLLHEVAVGGPSQFPTTMLTALWVLQRHSGAEFTLATMARAPAGIAIYAGFCLALQLAAGPLPPVAAWAIAVAAAVVIALLRARLASNRPPVARARRPRATNAFDATPPRPYMFARQTERDHR
jgi:hypothetical protein